MRLSSGRRNQGCVGATIPDGSVGLARVSESVPVLGVHNSNKTSTTAAAKMPAMVQTDGFCFRPYIATSL